MAGYYQPLAMISLMTDDAAGGSESNLRPFHITSLALHTANTALIIMLLYMLFGNIWAAAAAGLLFGVHPMTVEPIPWVGEQNVIGGIFRIVVACFLRSLFAQQKVDVVCRLFCDVSIGIDVEADECGLTCGDAVDGLLAA